MIPEATYTDKLVTIRKDEIIFHNYYFPFRKSKFVKINDIQSISVKKPTIWNGKWRLHGTGNFKIWFPADHHRPKRDRIFIATLRSQWVRIGFTVQDGERVEKLLRSMNLIETQ